MGNICLFVAQQCNMACVYCYGQSGEYTEKGMMSAAIAFKAVDWLMENSGNLESVNVGFFGGEPMMNFPLIRKVVNLDGPGKENAPFPDRANERLLAMEESLAQALLREIKARAVGEEAKNSAVGFLVSLLISSEKRRYFCGVGRGMLAVTAAGDIYPCHRFAGQQEVKLGNLDSYKPDGMNDYHRAIVDNLPECQRCWARYACGGGCFYMNKAVRGDMRLPDRSSCAELKAMIEMAIALYLQLDNEDKEYVKDVLKEVPPERRP